jgi:hypothetical protein
MQMLYNSENFAVVQITLAASADDGELASDAQTPVRGGFEIVDKAAGREIFIQGALAERFQQGVQALVDAGKANEEAFDDYIAGYAGLAQQPLVLH